MSVGTVRNWAQLAVTGAAILASSALLIARPAQDRPSANAVNPQRRLALVIGNDSYAGGMALQNARRDSSAIAEELKASGFQVTLVHDATRARMNSALETFAGQVGPLDVGLFYYAGHGVQVRNENYLLPVDYTGSSETAVTLNGVSATQIQTFLSHAQIAILVLDACRNNPYSGQRSLGGGLAPMEARGSLIVFSTGAGETAGDNPAGRQGTFTGAMIEALREPGLTFREVFFSVRKRVVELTGGRQFPALYDGLLGDVVLRPASSSSVAAAPSSAPVASGNAAPPRTAPRPTAGVGRGSTGVPAPPAAAVGTRSRSVRAPEWLVGEFRGVNPLTKANVELSVGVDGTIAGIVGAGATRATAVRYEWQPDSGQVQDPTGAYVFDVERTDSGFRMSQVGSPANLVEYRRIYLPPGAPSATGTRGDLSAGPRQATPDEQTTMLGVIEGFKAAWQDADGPRGQRTFPTWNPEIVRNNRAKDNVEKATATLACADGSVRRDQATVRCRATIVQSYKRRAVNTRGSQITFGQKAPDTTRAYTWTFRMFWNGSTWLIEGLDG